MGAARTRAFVGCAALKDVRLISLRKEYLSALLCTLMWLVGTLFVTKQGMHWLELFDTFVANVGIFLVGGLECVAITWVYGAPRFASDAIAMCGRSLPKPLLWDLQFVVPLLMAGLLARSLLSSLDGDFDFTPTGIACGWALALACAAPVPIVAWRELRPCGRLWARCAHLRSGSTPRPDGGSSTHGLPREHLPPPLHSSRDTTELAAPPGADDKRAPGVV